MNFRKRSLGNLYGVPPALCLLVAAVSESNQRNRAPELLC